MAKRTPIISLKPLTVNDMQFNIDFCHQGGEGYRIYVTPYAINVNPYDSPTALILTGSGSCPGMAHARLLNCSRPSKANTAAQRPIAIAKIAEMVKDMLVAYGLEVDKTELLAQVEQAAEVSA